MSHHTANVLNMWDIVDHSMPQTVKLLDIVVRSAVFLAGGVLESNLAHRESVAVLCMLFKIKSSPMHPQSDALPHVPACVTRGALVAHSHSSAPPRY